LRIADAGTRLDFKLDLSETVSRDLPDSFADSQRINNALITRVCVTYAETCVPRASIAENPFSGISSRFPCPVSSRISDPFRPTSRRLSVRSTSFLTDNDPIIGTPNAARASARNFLPCQHPLALGEAAIPPSRPAALISRIRSVKGLNNCRRIRSRARARAPADSSKVQVASDGGGTRCSSRSRVSGTNLSCSSPPPSCKTPAIYVSRGVRISPFEREDRGSRTNSISPSRARHGRGI